MLCSKDICSEEATTLVNETWPVCDEHLKEVAEIFKQVAKEGGEALVMRLRRRVSDASIDPFN